MKILTSIVFVFFLLAGCSHKTEDQAYTDGLAAEDQNDFQSALKNYQDVVDHTPPGPHADSAQFRIGMVYNNDLHDIAKAVAAYRVLYLKYPQSSFAPTAMFLTAFLMNNQMHQYDSARILYEEFLQKYPKHDLATSARFELSTLGKEPSQFLGQDSVASSQNEKATRKKASRR